MSGRTTTEDYQKTPGHTVLSGETTAQAPGGVPVSVHVNMTEPEINKPRREAPPEPKADQKLRSRAMAYFGLNDDRVLKVVGLSKDDWNGMQMQKQEQAIKIVTTGGRKLFYVPGAKFNKNFPHTCYFCERPMEGWLDSGRCSEIGHPPWLHLCPACGHGVLHDGVDINLVIRAKAEELAVRAPSQRPEMAARKAGIVQRPKE